MGAVVLFEPHHDDAVLFACYQLLRWKPLVVTVFGDARVLERYGVTGRVRSDESQAAIATVGLDPYPQGDWIEWREFRDDQPDYNEIAVAMGLVAARTTIDLVLAPLPEVGGHEQHNFVGEIAYAVFGDRVRYYATYRRGEARTRTENEVEPEPGWRARKFRAMSHYASQIELDTIRPWFCASDILREWVA